jgi:glycerol-3-phosphate acyltransferase PlsX
MRKHKDLMPRVEIIHTTVGIGMNEHPASAIRTKPNSSIVLGMEALKAREDCTAFVSAGSTGAVLTGGFMRVGRIPGVSRPALCPILPTVGPRGVMVLDVGANMDCKPINLVHFALMADVYMRAKGVDNPRIGLLNVGTEDEKGNELTHEAFAMLKKMPINFIGNMEARETFGGNYDIVVTDGFAGNVLLKTLEGGGKFFAYKLKRAISGPLALPGKLLLARRL